MKRTISKQKVEGVAKRFPLRLKIVTGVRKDNNAGLEDIHPTYMAHLIKIFRIMVQIKLFIINICIYITWTQFLKNFKIFPSEYSKLEMFYI